MKRSKTAEKLIEKLNLKASPELDQRIHSEISKALTQAKQTESALTAPNIWRIIMKNRMTKLAAMAVIIIGLGMTAYLIDKATTPVWAIDQSIEAMKDYRGIHFSGMISMSWKDFFNNLGVQDLPEFPESQGEFEMWAQADEELSRSSKVKMILPDNIIISGRKLQFYVQLANGTTYDVQGDHVKIQPWPTSKLLEIMKDVKDTWTELYGMDADTGKERIFVKASSADTNQSWEFEFDFESKLLVSLRQWNNNNNHEGLPNLDIWKIVYYEQLPDDIFEIDLPDSSEIIAIDAPLDDPDYGMSAEGLTQEQACHIILTEFWQAVSEQDLDKTRKLFPYAASWSDEVLTCNLGGDRGPVELLELGQIYEGKIGPVVPCTLQFNDGEMVIIDMRVMFREIDGKASCIVHSNKGQLRPVE